MARDKYDRPNEEITKEQTDSSSSRPLENDDEIHLETADLVKGGKKLSEANKKSTVANTLNDTFTSETAENAKGNFLVTIGYPGSGKSTFNSHLYRMCRHAHTTETLLASGKDASSIEAKEAMEARLNAWQRTYTISQQVERTEKGEQNIFEIAFRVIPKSRPKLPLDLRLIEVSGEDLRQLTNQKAAQIPRSIGALLSDKKLNQRNVIIAFMVDPDPNSKAVELLINGLLSYMQVHSPKRLEKTNFCLIVPKPAKMIEVVKDYYDYNSDTWNEKYPKLSPDTYNEAKDIDRGLSKAYIETVRTQILESLKPFMKRGNTILQPFYIGEIENIEGEKERQISQSYRDASIIFKFLYETFHNGKKLKDPGFLGRLFGK